MMPTLGNSAAPVPPPAYHRAQARLGPALHIDALTFVNTLHLLTLCRLAVRLAHHRCPPLCRQALAACLGPIVKSPCCSLHFCARFGGFPMPIYATGYVRGPHWPWHAVYRLTEMAITAFRVRRNSASAANSVVRRFLRRSLSSACSPPFVVGLLGPAISSLIVPPSSPGTALIPMLLMAMLLLNIRVRSCAAIASILSSAVVRACHSFFSCPPKVLHDAPFARPLLVWAVHLYAIRPRFIRLDAAYCGLKLTAWIHATLGAVAVIPWNPKRQKNRSCLPPTWTKEELGKRSGIERFFGRVFLFFHLQRPPLSGWSTIARQVALTYTATIIVALAAQQARRPDLIRSPKRVLAHWWEGV